MEAENRKKKNLNKWLSTDQMSDSVLVMSLLTLSGGLQDAYTYWGRGEVFANAQTGNFVLMAGYAISGEWGQVWTYLIPVLSFALGILLAEIMRQKFKTMTNIHWRQRVLLVEILLLAIVGFLPKSMDFEANALVSLSCALQVQSFRRFKGYNYASTMCIGNLRSAMEAAGQWIITGEGASLIKSLQYLRVIGIFALGAGLGAYLTFKFSLGAIWASCFLLGLSFVLMQDKFLVKHVK